MGLWWRSEATKPTKAEFAYIPGKFALPRQAPSRVQSRTAMTDVDDEPDGGDQEDASDHDSDWSGTLRVRELPENVLVSGVEPDHREAVGVVGGTIMIKGVHGSDERAALVRVFRGVVNQHILSKRSKLTDSSILYKRNY